MRNISETKMYSYSGVLAKICEDFVQEKRAVGYLYNTEAKRLSEFSRFTLNFNCPKNTLPEEIVKAWITKKPTDSDRNQYARFSLISQFAKYMERMNYSAYIPHRNEIGKLHKTFMPYIFTHDEIQAFFRVADSMRFLPHSIAPRRHLIMPVLFRMLYCCGLRVSEATALIGSDVDLEKGILIIRNSKFGKTRYVPISDELKQICIDYNKTRHKNTNGIDWFFAAPDGGSYDTRTIYGVFRELLWKSGISHGGKGNGPRLHDLRHTFCVHCLQKWTMQGEDPTTLLPRLTAYLGHNDFTATEKYLRMTAEAYPEVLRILEENYGYIIPKMEDFTDENN